MSPKKSTPKESKNSKGSKGPNAETTGAGLSLNVKFFKTTIKSYYENRDIKVESKDADGNIEQKLPMVSGGHIALTAVVEALFNYVLKGVQSRLRKDKTSLRRLDRPTLRQYVMEADEDLKKFFLSENSQFNPEMDYDKSFPVSSKVVESYISNAMGKDFMVTRKGLNFFFFCLVTAMNQLMRTSSHFMLYGKRKSLDSRSVRFSVQALFTERLAHFLNSKLDRAMKSDDERDDDEVEDDENVEEHDSDADEDDDDEEDGDDEDEDEEEQAPPPKRATKGNKGKGKGKAKK